MEFFGRNPLCCNARIASSPPKTSNNAVILLVFVTEEPTRFGIGCLGSRMLSGTLSADAAGKLKDRDGESVDEVRRKAGLNGNLQDVRLPTGYYKGFVELHIEQGPLLETGENITRNRKEHRSAG